MTKEFCFTERELQELLDDTISIYLVHDLMPVLEGYAKFFTVKEIIEGVKAAKELMEEKE